MMMTGHLKIGGSFLNDDKEDWWTNCNDVEVNLILSALQSSTEFFSSGARFR